MVVLVCVTASPAGASLMTHSNFVDQGSQYFFVLTTENNDPGAEYNSRIIDLSTSVDDIVARTGNSSSDVINAMTAVVLPAPGSTAFNGWSASFDPSGDVHITHGPGIPGLSWDVFDTGEKMNLAFGVNKSVFNGMPVALGEANPTLVEAAEGIIRKGLRKPTSQ